jgi:epidermal growth factor receptor substrate 15
MLMIVPDQTGAANSSAVVGSGFSSTSMSGKTSTGGCMTFASWRDGGEIQSLKTHREEHSTIHSGSTAIHQETTTTVTTERTSTHTESSRSAVESSRHDDSVATTVCQDSNTHEISSNSATTPGTIVTVPNTAPATPKRAVKLATASSAAADWFSKGGLSHLGSIKKDVKEATEIVRSVIENTIVSESQDVSVSGPEVREITLVIPVDPPQSDATEIVETHSVETGTLSSVMLTCIENLETVVAPSVVESELEVVEASSVSEAVEVSPPASVVEATPVPFELLTTPALVANPSPSRNIVLDGSIMISFNVYRPYIHRRTETSPEPAVTKEESSSTQVTSETIEGNAETTKTTTTTTTTTETITTTDDAATDDSSDATVVVEQGAHSSFEPEGVKRRWFREEMRQSPVSSVFSMLIVGARWELVC